MKILSAFLLTFMFILTGCGNTSSGGDVHVDSSKYLRVSVASNPNNSPVPINKYVMLSFSAAIDGTTVDASSVYIADEDNDPIIAVLSVSEEKISIIPSEFFLPEMQYTIVVTTAVKDIEGRTLENIFTFTFVTALTPDTTPPSLVSLTPAEGTSADKATDVVMSFDEVISNNGAVLEVRDSIMNTLVSGTSTISDNALRFIPDSDLIPGANYTVSLQDTVEDLAGNAYTGITSWNFSVNPLVDTTPPSLISLTPAEGTSADKTTDVVMSFDEVIANNGAVLEVRDSIMNTLVSGTSTISDNALRFIPDSDLIPGANYTASLQGSVTDLAGNAYAGITSWEFSIVAVTDLSVLSVRHYGRLIGIEFSEHLDPLTVSENDFAINGGTITFKLFILHENVVILKANSNINGTEDIGVSGTIKDIYGNSHNNGVPAIYNLGG